ncbi:MAG: dihydrolipoyl dehydrogenase family protein [bacterium]
MQMEQYDLCVIGGGPSGYAAAMRAVDFGKKVILLERNRVGGAGIYNGALSSKTFWELAQSMASMRGRLESFGMDFPKVHFGSILKEVDDAVFERSSQLEEHLRRVERESNGQFRFVRGFGRMLNTTEVEVRGDFDPFTIQAEHTIVATGSRPRLLPNVPIDERTILTSDGISSLREFPESIVIVGAGVIGCEFATIFSAFGRTEVRLIAKDDHILPFEDRDLSQVIEQNMEDNGVFIHRNARLISMDIIGGKVNYVIGYPDGSEEAFEAEKALISIGRVPNIENTGLKELGVALDRGGCVDDVDTQTNIPNIYSVGDMTADIALVNVGELEGRHAVERIFGDNQDRLIYENISTIMFLSPEVAGVGMNEQQAQQAGVSYRVASFDFRCIPRAVAMRKTQGFFKILVTDDEEMKILGMRALGEHASSAIQAVALLISMNKGISELAELIHPHPSIIEGIQECVRMLLKKSIYKPTIFTEMLQLRRWRDGHYIE